MDNKQRRMEFVRIGNAVGELVAAKNAAYGGSYFTAGQFLQLLWPEGVPPKAYDDMLTIVRMFDKMARIATDKDAFGEDPYQDIMGYAILAIQRRRENGKGKEVTEKEDIGKVGGREVPESDSEILYQSPQQHGGV